jgi:2-keto-4-pentenoate hydratase/2-oxohepta-3-ene-1,7-dioic acid hydratase in catechol pathway
MGSKEHAMKKIRFRGSGNEIAVGKILCVGQNYAKHIEEMKGTRPENPVLFFKPSTALVSPVEPIRLPGFSKEVHHEVELVVVIGKVMRHVSQEDALAHVGGYAVGIDLTARDWQREAKKQGGPWAVAKGFDGSAPLSEITPADEVGDPGDLAIQLSMNGEIRQSARTSEMLFSLPELLAFASRIFTLEPGDLLFTGTPSGVGPISAGDRIEVEIERVGRAAWQVERA